MKETTVNGDFPICFYAAQPLHRVFLPAFRFGAVRQLAGDVSMALALLAHQIRGAFPARIEALVDLSGEGGGCTLTEGWLCWPIRSGVPSLHALRHWWISVVRQRAFWEGERGCTE